MEGKRRSCSLFILGNLMPLVPKVLYCLVVDKGVNSTCPGLRHWWGELSSPSRGPFRITQGMTALVLQRPPACPSPCAGPPTPSIIAALDDPPHSSIHQAPPVSMEGKKRRLN